MAKEDLKWERLDNTANIFPVIAGEDMTNTYRLSVILKEEIDPEILQQAVDRVTPKFPGFNLRLRIGFFWFYFEENGKKAPRVKPEDTYPCRLIHATKNNSYLFRVTYYKTRINVEAFHALTDGMGIIGFTRELAFQYLRLSHPELMEKMGDGLSADTSLDREDSYKRNYKKGNKSIYKSTKSFMIRGEKLPYDGFGVVHGFMQVAELKKAAKEKYGCSINEYLIAAYIYAIYQENRARITVKKPVRIAVPVNLRPFFESSTTKNFFAMVSAEFKPEKDDYSFEEITAITRESLRSQITKENLEAIFSYNVSNEDLFISRAVPLPLKNMAMKFIYEKNATANTSTVTNIGNIQVPPEYEPYIDMFYSFLSFSIGQNIKATITSYKDTLVYTFTSAYMSSAIQRNVFRQIARDGVSVRIETNGVY